MFYEARQKKQRIFKVLSCIIYIIISNYVCIDYLGYQRKIKCTTSWFCWELKTCKKSYDNVLGIGIPDLLMNLMSCHGFLKNKDYVFILKFSNRMFEYCFSKGFIHFDCKKISLEKLPSDVK